MKKIQYKLLANIFRSATNNIKYENTRPYSTGWLNCVQVNFNSSVQYERPDFTQNKFKKI